MSDVKSFSFEGTVTYCMVRKPNQFGKFSVNFYPKDNETRKAIKATGIRSQLKEDETGFYYTFNRPDVNSFGVKLGAPAVTYEAVAYDGLVGNGSEGVIHVDVETFTSKQYGEVTRGTWVSFDVKKLVEYTPPSAEAPAEATPVGATLAPPMEDRPAVQTSRRPPMPF